MNIDVDIEHENAYEDPELGTLWTNGEDVGILAVVDYKKTQTLNHAFYAVITLESEHPNRFNDPTTDKTEAVKGLDLFYGTVTLSQK